MMTRTATPLAVGGPSGELKDRHEDGTKEVIDGNDSDDAMTGMANDCDNIHSWISTTGDLVFSHQQEFTVFNSQIDFWRSLPEISFFSLFCQS